MSKFWRNLKYKLSWNHIKFVIKDIPNRIRDMYLCWKYPFLRLRNAYSGLEHNWWPAREYHRENWGRCVRNVFVKFEHDENFSYDAELLKGIVGVTVHINLESGLQIEATTEHIYVIYDNRIQHTYNLNDYFKCLPTAIHLEVSAETELSDNIILRFKGGEAIPFDEYSDGVSRFCTVVTNRWLYTKINILDWIEKYPYLTKHIANKLGYWYFLNGAELPEFVSGLPAMAKFYFENKGFARAYNSFTLKFKLVSRESGREYEIYSNANLNEKWLSETVTKETVRLDLSAVPAGEYVLCVGMFEGETPIKMGFRAECNTEDGFYEFDSVTVE